MHRLLASSNEDQDFGLAFGLVIGAGLATSVGAAAVFSPRLIKLANKKFLAASLGFSCGVMLYVSFVEIFQKSLGAFQEVENVSEGAAYLYSTLCFFGGVALMKVLNFMVSKLESLDRVGGGATGKSDGELGGTELTSSTSTSESNVNYNGNNDKEERVRCGCAPDGETVDRWQTMAERELQQKGNPVGALVSRKGGEAESNIGAVDIDVEIGTDEEKGDKQLVRMGLNTALAIGIHNFPEGLATFIATLDDPSVGISLAVAIAVHNIPEGLCVAIPVYYATGNRKKAFLWAMLSGVTEPIGALIGWVVLKGSVGETTYGILFGLVSGMMVMICLHELIPTAHSYDPGDKIVTNSVVIGMIVMALSLVLFVF